MPKMTHPTDRHDHAPPDVVLALVDPAAALAVDSNASIAMARREIRLAT